MKQQVILSKNIQILLYFTLFILLFLSLFNVNSTPRSGLDPSWQYITAYAFQQNWQAGIDYVFNHGPLSYLSRKSIYFPPLFTTHIFWQIIIACWASIIFLLELSLQTSIFRRILYLLVLLIILAVFKNDTVLYLAITANLLLIIYPPNILINNTIYLLFSLFTLITLGLLALSKFTFFIFLCFFSPIIFWFINFRLSLSFALFSLVFFIVVMWFIWTVIAGQLLTTFPHFIINFLEIVKGYSVAMATGFKPYDIILAMVSFGLLLVMLFLWFIETQAKKLLKILTVLIIVFCAFMVWKAGFVRHDHAAKFFISLAVLPFFIKYAGKTSMVYLFNFLLVINLFICIHGFLLAKPQHKLIQLPSDAIERINTNFNNLINITQLQNNYQQQWNKMKQNYALPKISQFIGNSSVDILTWELSLAFFNEFNLQSRPIWQSYTAYTPRLQKLNADFYRDSNAPNFIIFKLDNIDRRLPMLADSSVLRIILQNYRPLFSEKGYLLLQKQAKYLNQKIVVKDLIEKQLSFEEVFDLQEFTEINLLLSLDIKCSWLGHLLSIIYRLPPAILIELDDKQGKKYRYRIIPDMAKNDFIFNPLITNQADWINLYQKQSNKKVTRLVLKLEPTWLHYLFEPEIKLKLKSVKNLMNSNYLP